eukprot:SAG31_NODE_34490_length_332_cov_0.969957_1_plen_87_part_10
MQMQPLSFANRVAIVTGGGRGLGRAHCLLLASRGCKVVVNNRTASKADEVVAEIRAAGGTAVPNYADVAIDAKSCVAQAMDLWDRVD